MDSTKAFIAGIERDYLLIRAIQFALEGLRRVQLIGLKNSCEKITLDDEIESLTAALLLLGGCPHEQAKM